MSQARSTHTLFSTGCSAYFDWQALGLAHSHRESQQPGKLTRLISECPDDRARVRSAWLPNMDTHEHPDYGKPEQNGVQDTYAPYNKAGGLVHWLMTAEKSAEKPGDRSSDYLLLLESDMLLRQPIDCAALGVRPGRAASSRYEYLKGASNGMARGEPTLSAISAEMAGNSAHAPMSPPTADHFYVVASVPVPYASSFTFTSQASSSQFISCSRSAGALCSPLLYDCVSHSLSPLHALSHLHPIERALFTHHLTSPPALCIS